MRSQKCSRDVEWGVSSASGGRVIRASGMEPSESNFRFHVLIGDTLGRLTFAYGFTVRRNEAYRAGKRTWIDICLARMTFLL